MASKRKVEREPRVVIECEDACGYAVLVSAKRATDEHVMDEWCERCGRTGTMIARDY